MFNGDVVFGTQARLLAKDGGSYGTDPGDIPLSLYPSKIFLCVYTPVPDPSKHARVSMRGAHNSRYDYLKLVQIILLL